MFQQYNITNCSFLTMLQQIVASLFVNALATIQDGN